MRKVHDKSHRRNSLLFFWSETWPFAGSYLKEHLIRRERKYLIWEVYEEVDGRVKMRNMTECSTREETCSKANRTSRFHSRI